MKRMSTGFLLLLCFILGNVGANRAHGQWVQQRSGVRMRLHDVVMLDSLTAVAVGQYGIILKTTNAGHTWVPKNISPIAQPRPHWNAIAFGSPAVGAVVGDNLSGAITTNGGETWRSLFITGTPLPLRNLRSIAFIGPNAIFIGGDSGYVLVSSNGGMTWQIRTFSGLPINDIFFSGSSSLSRGYIITPRLAFQTTDLGLTWLSQPLPVLGLGYARRGDITMNGDMAYAVGADGDFTTTPVILMRARTDTSWRRWLYMPPIPGGLMNDVSAPTPQAAFAAGRSLITPTTAGNQGMVFKTTNAGQFWSAQYGFRRGLNAVDFISEKRGYVVGDSGAIFFTASGGGRVINAFPLLYPHDGDTLSVGATFRFQWGRSPDLEPDTRWYQLFTSTTGPDGPWSYHMGTVDTITPPLPVPSPGQHWWMVQASDGMNAATCELALSFVTIATTGVSNQEKPLEFALDQNYPNPFNPNTAIGYQIPTQSHVMLKVFDVLGREVATLVNEVKEPGTHTVQWDGANLAGGIYLLRLDAGTFTSVRKLLLLK